VVIALDRQWPNFCQAIGRPDLVADPRYATARDRARNRQELIELTEAWMQSFATDQEVLDQLETHRVPCAPVLSPSDTLEHPYYKEREMVRTVHDPVLGPVRIPGFPFKFSERPDLPDLVAPTLGEHNEVVLAGWAGYDRQRIEELAQAGILCSRERD
jgi:crotonobetainyl-CoA:carnitine CoA-transferase CaiB-like acyl-CoA transferase